MLSDTEDDLANPQVYEDHPKLVLHSLATSSAGLVTDSHCQPPIQPQNSIPFITRATTIERLEEDLLVLLIVGSVKWFRPNLGYYI